MNCYLTSLAAIAVPFLLSACSSAIALADLKVVPKESVIRLTQSVHWYEEALAGAGRSEWEVIAGDYVSAYEDEGGVYYIGPPFCYRKTFPFRPPQQLGHDCGIYSPKLPGKASRIFILTGFEHLSSGPAFERTKSPSNTSESDRVVNSQIATTVAMNPGASPLQAGIAGGIAAGIISASAAKNGSYYIVQDQPPEGALEKSAIHR